MSQNIALMKSRDDNPASPVPRAPISLFAVLAVVLGVVFVIVFGFLMLKRLDVQWWGNSTALAEAQSAVKKGDWPAALQSIQQVPAEERDQADFLRVLADYLQGTRTNPDMLARTIASLEAAGALQPADFLWMCREQLREGRLSAARRSLESIPPALRTKLEVMEVEIQLLQMEGKTGDAKRLQKTLETTFATEPAVILRSAVREMEGTFPEIQSAAREQLWTLAAREDGYGLAAVRVLGKRQDLALHEAVRLRQIVKRHPQAQITDHLTVLSAIIRLDPSQKTSIIDAALQDHHRGRKEEMQALAAWLAQQGEFERMQRFCTGTTLLNSAELFQLLAQGLAEQKRWAGLDELLSPGHQIPVSPARASTWRALAAHHLHPNDVHLTRKHLTSAIKEGAQEKNTLAILGAARIAEVSAMPDLALQAYLTLAKDGGPDELSILEKCWETATLLKDSKALLVVAEQQHHLRPEEPRYQQRFHYLSLLTGKVPEAPPLPLRTTSTSLLIAALHAYRTSPEGQNVATLIRQIAEPETLPPGKRAVLAGLLAHTRDDLTKAFKLAETTPTELLLPEERSYWDMAH